MAIRLIRIIGYAGRRPVLARKPADQSVNKQDILWAAAEVLRHNGYEATTMKDIAAQVNLTAASLYHHFKSKDFLLLNVLELGLERSIANIEPITRSNLSYADKLKQMIRIHVTGVTGNTAVGAAMVFEIRALLNVTNSPRNGDDESDYLEFVERRNKFFERRDYFESLFRGVVKEGIKAGEFRQLDHAIFAKAMLGAHNWVGVWYKEGGRLTGDQVADVMIDTFLSTLLCK